MAKRVKDDKDIPLGADVTPSAPQPPLKKRKSVTGTAVAAAAVETVASGGQNHTAQGAEDTASKRGPTTGVILRSGRIRLPDKLMQYLNNGVAPESLFWQEDCQGFSINCDRVQKELLDKYFHGTKLSSFLRSMNRWGFKRLFYHSMPKSTLSFHHPLFRKDDPDLSKEMNMAPCSSSSGGNSSGAAAKDSKKKAAKESPPPPPPQPKPAPAPLAAPSSVQEPAVAVASVAPAPVVAAPSAPPVAAAPAAVAPAPTSAFVQTIAGGLAGQLRDQTAIQNAAKELLLKQAIANSQQQQQTQQQKQQLEQSMLLQQALASAQQHQQQQQQRQPSLENANAVIQQAVAAIQQKQQQDATTAILQHVLSNQGNTNISNNAPSSVLLSTILDAAKLTQTVPSPAPQVQQPQVQLQLQQLQLQATGTQAPPQPLQLQIQPATAAQLQQLAQAQAQAQQQVNTASSSQANTATTTATAPSNQLATLASALASGRLNLSSTAATPAPAPTPTPATSVSQQLQLLTPEQQLALLTQVSANRAWGNPN